MRFGAARMVPPLSMESVLLAQNKDELHPFVIILVGVAH